MSTEFIEFDSLGIETKLIESIPLDDVVVSISDPQHPTCIDLVPHTRRRETILM